MGSPRKAMGRIVLIQPHCSFTLRGESALNTQFDSIGLLALAAYAETKGFDATVFHVARALAQGWDRDRMLARLTEPAPLLFGLSINWLHLSLGAIELARLLRQRCPGVPIIVGGQHASFFADEIITDHHDLIDAVAVGEGEETLVEAARRSQSGQSLDGTPGLVTFAAGAVQRVPRRVGVALAELPLLSYDVVEPEPAASDPTRRVAALDTSRGGCRKDCTYCLESCTLGGLGRARPEHHEPERLADQILAYVRQGRDWITIQDQLFTHGDAPLLALLEGLRRRQVRLPHLSLFLEPGSYSTEVYRALRDAPVDELVLSFGVETGSPKVARLVHRIHDYDRIYRELEALGRERYWSSTWWMVGLPEEGPEEIAATQRMIVETMRMGIHPKWVTPLILFPQTELAKQAARFGIRPLLRTFADFTRFSVTPRNEYGAYPELITHESEVQSKADTLRHVVGLKQAIEVNLPALDAATRDKTEVSAFARFRRATFF